MILWNKIFILRSRMIFHRGIENILPILVIFYVKPIVPKIAPNSRISPKTPGVLGD